MDFATLGSASETEIIQKIDESLALAFSDIADMRKPGYAIQTQMLIQELAGREQRCQTATMVLCTKIVTVMTGIILILTVVTTWATLSPLRLDQAPAPLLPQPK